MDDWNECIIENAVITITADEQKVKSLVAVAKGRISFFEKQNPVASDINYIFEGFYTSIVDLLHAITIKDGFMVKNHICLGYYLRDKLNHPSLFLLFDDLRYKRNSLIYYGINLEFAVALDAITKSKSLLQQLNSLL